MNCLAIAAIGLHLVSWHDEPGYNNVNPGVYVESQCGFTLGAYKNSIRELSVYAAYTYDPKKLPVWATVGVVTGYKRETNMGITPIAMVGVKTPEVQGYRLRVGWIPKVGGVNNVNVVHLMIEKRF